MIKKDLAYSIDEIMSFLCKIEHVKQEGEHVYSYKSAKISLEAHRNKNEVRALETERSVLAQPIDRCYMYLSGNEDDYNEFYKIFLVNNLTMGA